MPDEDFETWLIGFKRKTAGKQALKALDELSHHGTADNFGYLHMQVLRACWQAANYTGDIDPHHLEREHAAEGIAKIPKQLEHIEALRAFSREYPLAAAHAMTEAIEKLRKSEGVEVTRRGRQPTSVGALVHAMSSVSAKRGVHAASKSRLVSPVEVLDDILAAYSEQLRTIEKPGLGGPARFLIGPLGFSEPVEDTRRKLDPAVMGLLFELVFFFRHWTDGGRGMARASTQWMPMRDGVLAGRPCYRQAALFVSAALDANLTAKQAQDRLEKLLKAHPKVTLNHWPN